MPRGGGPWAHASAPFPAGTAPAGALRPALGALWSQHPASSQSQAHVQQQHRLQQLHHLQQMQQQMQQQHRFLSLQRAGGQAGAPTSSSGPGVAAPRVLDEHALAQARQMQAQMQAQLQEQMQMQMQMQRMQAQGPGAGQPHPVPGQGARGAPVPLARALGAAVTSAPTHPAPTQAPQGGLDPRLSGGGTHPAL